MEKLGLNEIREKFLSFFESKGHLRHKSFPLVPQGDQSLLLINSGMAPLKPYFSGEAVPPSKRITTCQKCIRTPDIERVGKTSRHGTFFEMLGNFSFGDYFKKEACNWAWEFITKELKIPTDNLYITVYLDDDETAALWVNEIGVDPNKISRLGKEDNFWEIGSGPCGPCSEIYFDRGARFGCGDPECKPGCECDRFVEFWNLVFTQFHNDGDGHYTELKHKNIDTGMGLERLACIMQGVDSLFDVDTILRITQHVSKITGVTYGESVAQDVSLRVITDHIRSTTMMICDGVLPSNEGRGYVLRRLLRRAARHGKLLGVSKPFLYQICETVIQESGHAYPELLEKQAYIQKVIANEEENFNKTIDAGMLILENMLEKLEAKAEVMLSGEDSFKLYDTYGFPVDLTLEILEERGLSLDREKFEILMNDQRERARNATAALGDFGWTSLDLGLDKNVETRFLGYETFALTAKILAIVSGDIVVSKAETGEHAILVLDQTPFYAESGGQVSDLGVITGEHMRFVVQEVRKSRDNKFMHIGTVQEGTVERSMEVTAQVDVKRRKAIMRAHSATHLLHQALRNVLGDHVAQAGSLVSADMIRFDFTHFSPLTKEELLRIDEEINEIILEGYPIQVIETDQEHAKELGATALFGEKYGDRVRVVSMGDYSVELCGGTHLDNTAKIGSYRTLSESSVASGVRRIEAIVGMGVLEQLKNRVSIVENIAKFFKTKPSELEQKAVSVLREMEENRKLLMKLRAQNILSEVKGFLSDARNVKGVKLLTLSLQDLETDDLRKIGDFLKSGDAHIAAVISNVKEEKLTFLAVCGKQTIAQGIRAGDLIKHVATLTGGSGGGKPDVAMGGGKDLSKLSDALNAVESYIIEHAAE